MINGRARVCGDTILLIMTSGLGGWCDGGGAGMVRGVCVCVCVCVRVHGWWICVWYVYYICTACAVMMMRIVRVGWWLVGLGWLDWWSCVCGCGIAAFDGVGYVPSFSYLYHTHTHTHTRVCVCVCDCSIVRSLSLCVSLSLSLS